MSRYATIKSKEEPKLGIEKALSASNVDIIGSILFLSGLLVWLLLPIILIVKFHRKG